MPLKIFAGLTLSRGKVRGHSRSKALIPTPAGLTCLINLEIRQANPADTPVVTEFNLRLAEETEDLRLPPERVSAGVAAVLRDSSKGLYFLAEQEGKVCGQVMITYEWSDWRNAWWWWVQSVWVEPHERRSGVYRALYAHVVEAARAEGCCGVRLYVERENVKAQATYRALGMTQAKYELFEAEL